MRVMNRECFEAPRKLVLPANTPLITTYGVEVQLHKARNARSHLRRREMNNTGIPPINSSQTVASQGSE